MPSLMLSLSPQWPDFPKDGRRGEKSRTRILKTCNMSEMSILPQIVYIAHSAPTTKGPDCCDVAYRGRRSLQRFRHLLTQCALRLAAST